MRILELEPWPQLAPQIKRGSHSLGPLLLEGMRRRFSEPPVVIVSRRPFARGKRWNVRGSVLSFRNAPTENQSASVPYMVEQWGDTDSHIEELIALTGDYRVARAAFEEAIKRRPGRISRSSKV
jgi:hypothetical protein